MVLKEKETHDPEANVTTADPAAQELQDIQRQAREMREQMAAMKSARFLGTGMSTKELVQQIQLTRARIELSRMQRSLMEEFQSLEAEQRRLEDEERESSPQPQPAAVPAPTPASQRVRVADPQPEPQRSGRRRDWSAATEGDVRAKGWGDAFYGKPADPPLGLSTEKQRWYREDYQKGLAARQAAQAPQPAAAAAQPTPAPAGQPVVAPQPDPAAFVQP